MVSGGCDSVVMSVVVFLAPRPRETSRGETPRVAGRPAGRRRRCVGINLPLARTARCQLVADSSRQTCGW
jgi:hypothetical protein